MQKRSLESWWTFGTNFTTSNRGGTNLSRRSKAVRQQMLVSLPRSTNMQKSATKATTNIFTSRHLTFIYLRGPQSGEQCSATRTGDAFTQLYREPNQVQDYRLSVGTTLSCRIHSQKLRSSVANNLVRKLARASADSCLICGKRASCSYGASLWPGMSRATRYRAGELPSCTPRAQRPGHAPRSG